MVDTKLTNLPEIGEAVTDTDVAYGVNVSGPNTSVKILYSRVKTYTSLSPTLQSPTLVTAVLGTPASGTLTNCTGLPITSGVSGLGANVANFLATPSSSNLATAVTDETGAGPLVFATSPTFTSAVTLGTQQTTQGSLILSNTAAGAFQTTLKSSNSATAAYTFTLPVDGGTNGYILQTNGSGVTSWVSGGGSGTVTSVAQSFTGGLISVSGSPITTSGTLALTVAGTSGGVPYFSSSSAWASSAALTANALVIGGGAGAAPATTTTGTGVITALGVNVGSAGAFVTFNGALGTPSSGTLTSCTGLPISTGVSGLGTGIATFLATPSSANLASAITDETGTGPLVFANSPTFTDDITLGTQQTTRGSIILANTAAGSFATTVQGSNSATAAWTLTLPVDAGTNAYVLQTNGSGVTSWVAQTGGGGTPGGSNTQVQFNDSSAFGGDAGMTYNKTTNVLTLTDGVTIGVQQTTQGSLVLANTAAGAFETTIRASNSATAAYTLTLPVDDGTVGQYLPPALQPG